MSAVQDAINQRQQGSGRLMRWPSCWAFLALPLPAIGYVLSLVAMDAILAGGELASTRPRARDLVLFVTLMACGTPFARSTSTMVASMD